MCTLNGDHARINYPPDLIGNYTLYLYLVKIVVYSLFLSSVRGSVAISCNFSD